MSAFIDGIVAKAKELDKVIENLTSNPINTDDNEEDTNATMTDDAKLDVSLTFTQVII